MGIQLDVAEIVGNCLLFCLVFGMSATVDTGCMMAQLRNRKAILTGLCLQFVILPFLGFAVVNALDLDHATGITLLVVTSSPGGSYSNWWCSMFNADLALSVTMTAISTILSTIMLPINLLIYAKYSYEDDVIGSLDWRALFTSLVVVIGAIGLGLFASDRIDSHNFNIHANRLGNFAGISLVIFSAVMSNSDEDSQLWERPWQFFFGVAAPCVLGLVIANVMTSCLHLKKPERVTTSIECCYQNVGIATSVALTMFEGDELAAAMGVPLYYGAVEAIVLGFYCIVAWKAGWTKAPPDEKFCTVISTSYEVLVAENMEQNLFSVEVGLSQSESDSTKEGDASPDGGLTQYHYYRHDNEEPPPPPPDTITSSPSSGTVLTPEIRRRMRRGPKERSFSIIKVQTSFMKQLGYNE